MGARLAAEGQGPGPGGIGLLAAGQGRQDLAHGLNMGEAGHGTTRALRADALQHRQQDAQVIVAAIDIRHRAQTPYGGWEMPPAAAESRRRAQRWRLAASLSMLAIGAGPLAGRLLAMAPVTRA